MVGFQKPGEQMNYNQLITVLWLTFSLAPSVAAQRLAEPVGGNDQYQPVVPRPATPCRLTSLHIFEPCESWGWHNGLCWDYQMTGSSGGSYYLDQRIDIQTTGLANEQSCILQTLAQGFQTSGRKNTRVDITKDEIADELEDGRYTFTGAYNSYKYKGGTVVQTFWNTIKENAGLREASYQEIRENYVNCIAWADNRADRYNSNGTHKGAYDGLAGGSGQSGIANNEYTCHDGTVYFDHECRLVSLAQAGAAGCSTVGTMSIEWLRGTPISLIFSTASNPLKTSTLVSFPLEPNQPNARWHWYGSSDAPVLVYDPEHSGKITSAHQLFGAWTFGGKRVAALAPQKPTAWKNGFEALAQLDHDGDGTISSGELEPLGLWFDDNRDAISQEGEVRTLKEVGIESLKVTYDTVDSRTGDVISSVGYTRRVDGKLVSGPSVDWITRGASSSKDLVLGSIFENSPAIQNDAAALGSVLEENSRTEDILIESAAALKAHTAITGTWMVRIDGDRPEEGLSSILMFNGGESKELSGLTLIEMGTSTAGRAARSMRFSGFNGTIEMAESSNVKLSFTTITKDAQIESEAVLDSDHKLMKGSSAAKRLDGITTHYTWTAKKVVFKK
jgi:hypothetical protein